MTVLRRLPRFRQATADLPRLAERERWPRERIEAFQLERLNAVWSRAVSDGSYWRELRSRGGLPPRFASLVEFRECVPVLGKELVRDAPERFLVDRPDAGVWCRTSGSTGTPMRIYRSHAGHQRVLRARYRFLQAWGLDIFDRTVFLMRPSLESASAVGLAMERATMAVRGRLRRRRWLWSERLGNDDLARLLERAEGFRPAVLYGYSSLVALLAAEAERRGRHLPGLELVILTSERASSSMVVAIERAFGVPAVIEYGATECEFLAGELPDRALRVREDVAMVETLPRADGRYDIVLTVLANSSFPLLRYAIGDVTERPLVTPPQGFAILGSVGGRYDDFLLARGGELLDSAGVEVVIAARPNVRRFRVRQARDGSVEVTVELADPSLSFDGPAIERELSALVGGFAVHARGVAALAPDRSGKHRVVVSERPAR